MNRIVHFDLYADDPGRAVKFYQSVFGWKAEKWAGPMEYWLVTTGPDGQPGINGGIGQRQEPSGHTTNTIDVTSLKEAEAKIVAAGGKMLEPRMAIPGVGWFALCLDTEGNRFGLMEADPEAR